MLPPGIIRHSRMPPLVPPTPLAGVSPPPAPRGTRLAYPPLSKPMLQLISHPLFWRMKIKIGILTVATFVALC